MTTFNLPDLGEGLAEAEIVRWHVKVGDSVKVDQPMVAVETAKAVVEVPSPYSGVITKLHGKPGDVVATGAPLVEFELQGAAGTAPAPERGAPAAAKSAPPAKKADPRAPDDSGTVVGSMPTSDDELVETAVAGSDIASPRERVRAAPAVRALAKRLGVDLTTVRGTGRGGLITVDDVMTTSGPTSMHTAATVTALKSSPAPRGAPAEAPPSGEPEKLRGLRRAMHQSMSLARDNVMNCTLFDDADLHAWGKGEDFTIRLLRAIGAAATAVPALNAWYDGENQSRRLMQRVDVAMAVDTPEGLLVPVVRDVARRSAAELRADVDRLKRGARDRTVAPEDLRDFTFMLSNFGMIAGRYATPVVVPPAVAILGAGKLSHDVVAVMGGIEAHLRMPLSLTFDHRCVTGGEAARFLAAVIQDLERAS
ncbi:MAG TPA: dihydrolipoamide acetyltransferase family protein [Steroidobacteraceae bacterium]|jgi:2-oxoisovalerate dehydrogenase E2 component (dihydrolipoyl transacylase)|nr:dihydrolipoamide acetyltransferase family protein [Steroidobacteraceae bacterium]